MCVLVVKSVQRWVSVVFLVFRTHGLWNIRWTAHQNDLKSPFTSESNIVLKVGVWYELFPFPFFYFHIHILGTPLLRLVISCIKARRLKQYGRPLHFFYT